MKFNKNNKKKSVILLTLLSFFTITASRAAAAIETSSKKESWTQTEQLLKAREKKELLEATKRNNDRGETLEKIELEKEWEVILSNKSEGKILLAFGRFI